MDAGRTTDLIDWVRVAELSAEVGADSFGAVVEVFLEEVDDLAARLAEAPDAGRIEADMHFLKGCALNLGFARLAGLCSRAEAQAAAGDAAGVDLATVLACLAASRRQFLQGCAEVNAA